MSIADSFAFVGIAETVPDRLSIETAFVLMLVDGYEGGEGNVLDNRCNVGFRFNFIVR